MSQVSPQHEQRRSDASQRGAAGEAFSTEMLIAPPVQHSSQIVRLNLCFAPAVSKLRPVTARSSSSIYWRRGECETGYRELHDQQTWLIDGTFEFTFDLQNVTNRRRREKKPRSTLTEEQKRESNRKNCAAYRQKRKEQGICQTCPNRAILGQTRCPTCAEKQRQLRQRRHSTILSDVAGEPDHH